MRERIRELLSKSVIAGRFSFDASMRAFSTFEQAKAHSSGYEDEKIAEVVAHKTRLLREDLLRNPTIVNFSRGDLQNIFCFLHVYDDVRTPLDVMEIGGACGATCDTMRHVCDEKTSTWAVVETPAMARKAREFFSDSKLTFHSDPDEAKHGGRHLLVASGVLQYMEDPPAALHDWFGRGFTYLYLTRNLVSPTSPVPLYVRQTTRLTEHGPRYPTPGKYRKARVSYPMTVLPARAIPDHVPDTYSIVYRFYEDGRRRIPGAAREPAEHVGYLVKRNTR